MKTAHLWLVLWWKFSTEKLFLMQNDLFSTVLGRNLSLSAPGLLTWKPVSAFTLNMKLPGSPACYSSTGRRFAMLMVIIIDPPKKKHLPSQNHTSGWTREGCVPSLAGKGAPWKCGSTARSCCTTEHPCLGQVCRSSVCPHWELLPPCVASPVLYQCVLTT